MAFCPNCGAELAQGTKFCFECGTPVTEERSNERRKEWAGKVIKCPSCGAELQNFVAICPSCGHELNSQNVSPSLRQFISDLDRVEAEISREPQQPAKGWKTWGIVTKVIWVIANILLCLIPLVARYALPYIKQALVKKDSSILSSAEKRKASIIENYVFPNEREAIIEGMLFVKSKIDFLGTETLNRKTVFWLQLWAGKADQIYEKAKILLSNDTIIKNAYTEISIKNSKVVGGIKRRAIGSSILLVLLCVTCFLVSPVFSNVGSSNMHIKLPAIIQTPEPTEPPPPSAWPEYGLATMLPRPAVDEGIIGNNDEGCYSIEIHGISPEQYRTYVDNCIDLGFMVGGERSQKRYKAYNNELYDLSLWYDGIDILSIRIEKPMEMAEIQWPSSELVSYIPKPQSTIGHVNSETSRLYSVYIANVTKEQYDEYVNSCMSLGFDVDYSKSADYYHANHAQNKKLYLSVTWDVRNIMEIIIKDY